MPEGESRLPPLDLVQSRQWPAPYSQSELWHRAALGDPIDLAHLAEKHSATSLAERVRVGGVVGRTALAALAHLADPFPALRPLCEALGRATPASAVLLLRAQLLISEAGPTEESLDPGALGICEQAWQKLLVQEQAAASAPPLQFIDWVTALRANLQKPSTTPIRPPAK